MSKPIAIQFGAGNIGRGFIGWLLHESGYHVIFSDVNADLVDEINRQKQYDVILAEENQTTTIISDISAINSKKIQSNYKQRLKKQKLSPPQLVLLFFHIWLKI